MNENISLVLGTIEQIALITKYRMELWDQAGKFKSKKEFDHIYKLNNDYFLDHFRNGKIIVPMYLENEQNIIAIGIGVIIQKPVVNLHNKGLEGFIFNMYTDERYRGMGLATKILEKIEHYFVTNEVYKITLESNEKSINLYKKIGMKNNKYYLEKKCNLIHG